MSTAMKLREEGKIEGKLEGINEGITKGKLEGIKEGITKGKLEGKIEGKHETARAMLKDGLSVTDISKYTGLSEEEIASIK